MIDRHWFLVVPRLNPEAAGHWHEKCVNREQAAMFKLGPWAFYEAMFPPGSMVAIASRVPPAIDDSRRL